MNFFFFFLNSCLHFLLSPMQMLPKCRYGGRGAAERLLKHLETDYDKEK